MDLALLDTQCQVQMSRRVDVAFAEFLRPDRQGELPLIVLPGLAEHGQEHDPPISTGTRSVLLARAAELEALLRLSLGDLHTPG